MINYDKLHQTYLHPDLLSFHHSDQRTIDEVYNSYSPVFILSTGRTGSKFLARLLNLSPSASAYHEPRPTLQYFSNYAYHHQRQDETLSKMIDGARMEIILETCINRKRYIESNQCLTFFAPVIRDLYKGSKFVHIVRHPGDFVRSAIRKGWHKNDSIWESGRVRMNCEAEWDRLDQIEKLSWVWYTTNKFIEDFKCSLDSNRTITFRMEDLIAHERLIEDLVAFAGIEKIPADKVKEIQTVKVNELRIGTHEPPNMKKVLDFAHYREWGQDMKEKIIRFTREIAQTYGYQL